VSEKSRTNHALSTSIDRRRWDSIFKDHPTSVPEGGIRVVKGDVDLELDKDVDDETGK